MERVDYHMTDESGNTDSAIIVQPQKAVEQGGFSESDYKTAATELNIRRPQLSRCKYLATLGRSTNYVNKHDQNLGTLVWTREQIMEDINRIDKIIDSNSSMPIELQLDGDAIVHLMQTKASFYKIIADSVVPNMEHLGDRRSIEEKSDKRQKTFAPGSNVTAVFVGGRGRKKNGNQPRVIIDAASGNADLS